MAAGAACRKSAFDSVLFDVTKYIALLRAVNVGGHGLVAMTDLRAAFTAAGCRNVSTYIQSGNVLFEASGGAATITKKVRAALRAIVDGDPEVMLRTVAALREMVEAAPFREAQASAETKPYVAFLSRRPGHVPRLPLAVAAEAVELVGMTGREVFAVSGRKKNGGFGYPNLVVEKAFGVPATSRSWSTVTKLLLLAESPNP